MSFISGVIGFIFILIGTGFTSSFLLSFFTGLFLGFLLGYITFYRNRTLEKWFKEKKYERIYFLDSISDIFLLLGYLSIFMIFISFYFPLIDVLVGVFTIIMPLKYYSVSLTPYGKNRLLLEFAINKLGDFENDWLIKFLKMVERELRKLYINIPYNVLSFYINLKIVNNESVEQILRNIGEYIIEKNKKIKLLNELTKIVPKNKIKVYEKPSWISILFKIPESWFNLIFIPIVNSLPIIYPKIIEFIKYLLRI
jgi:hypothetical protein